jgi:hypothetical protein
MPFTAVLKQNVDDTQQGRRQLQASSDRDAHPRDVGEVETIDARRVTLALSAADAGQQHRLNPVALLAADRTDVDDARRQDVARPR